MRGKMLHKQLARATPVSPRKPLFLERKAASISQQTSLRRHRECLQNSVMMYTSRQISFMIEVIESSN
jgi:hypothetical protein